MIERVEGLSIRALAERHGVHRRTVRQALESARSRRRGRRRCAVGAEAGPVQAVDRRDAAGRLDAPRKQRHTARRVLARLVDEHGVERPVVLDGARLRRRAAAGDPAPRPAGGLAEAFVPQTHQPGRRGRGRLRAICGSIWPGCRTKCFLFTLRLSYSGKAVHRVVRHPGAGGVPGGPRARVRPCWAGCRPGKIRYDNLKSAVSRVLFGRNRVESDRWVAFRSHYGFDAFYCQPGIEGAHEKGGVEGEGGRFRRNHWSRCPRSTRWPSSTRWSTAADAGRRRTAGSATGPAPSAQDFAARAAAAAAAAGRAVRDRADADPAGRPVRPGHGPAVTATRCRRG